MMEIHNLKHAKKIGIIGGTFDPIHYGHLTLAEEARLKFGLDAVIFMPAGQPPHKTHGYGRVITDPKTRFEMAVAATAANPRFYVSRHEIERQGKSFTIDTIRNLQKMLPESSIYFIIGADAFFEIEKWKEANELLTLCEFIAATRAGESTKKLKRKVNKLINQYNARIHYLEIPGIDISSTNLRRRIECGASLKYLVPARVERYIKDHGLYAQDEMELWRENVKQVLKKMLSRERYAHTMGVCAESVRLARLYGADIEKAYTAALLHDCARGLTEQEQLDYCRENNIELDSYTEINHNPVHAVVGAHIARHTFAVTDKQILNAIKRHCVGNKKMTLLDKIIFVADATEAGRGNEPMITAARAAAGQNIKTAIKPALEIKTRYLVASGGELHPKSLKMLKKY